MGKEGEKGASFRKAAAEGPKSDGAAPKGPPRNPDGVRRLPSPGVLPYPCSATFLLLPGNFDGNRTVSRRAVPEFA